MTQVDGSFLSFTTEMRRDHYVLYLKSAFVPFSFGILTFLKEIWSFTLEKIVKLISEALIFLHKFTSLCSVDRVILINKKRIRSIEITILYASQYFRICFKNPTFSAYLVKIC